MATKLDQLNESSRRLNNIQDAIKRWFGFHEVINLTKRAISGAINHIRELDKVMTEIAVVTDMTQKELWDQIETYSTMAQKYGATTQGVYEVSQLYYQQGLQTAEVMQLTEETLKMAKIANIDYADATDYMTVAIRGFKMEMSDAQNVVDVYSNIAAITASDTEELAVAMSKTASSAEAVGSSFENTTAMIALMVETTREAPENIGSAMKSIISRYGEMTTNPEKLVDSEGEAMSLNKVDKALSSVGITLQDVNGQFRDFDEVILELSSKWDTIDKNTQRYIATVMAGNRQQSRFLALVGNYDRLSELYEEAADSQDAAALQTLKTMDSIETKINQLKTTFQEFYTSTGIETLIKGLLDFATQAIERLNGIPKVFDKIPLAAIGVIGTLITTAKAGATLLMRGIFQVFDSILPEVKVKGIKIGEYLKKGIKEGSKGVGEQALKELDISKRRAKWGTALGSAGMLISSLSLALGDLETKTQRVTSGVFQIGGGVVSAVGQFMTGNYIGGIISIVSTLASGISTIIETAEERIKKFKENIEEASNATLTSKNELKTLTDYKKKYEELYKKQHISNEAKQEFLDLNNEIANKYPELISYVDSEGNSIVSLAKKYEDLYKIKKDTYEQDLLNEQVAYLNALSDPKFLTEETDYFDRVGDLLSTREGWFNGLWGNVKTRTSGSSSAETDRYYYDVYQEHFLQTAQDAEWKPEKFVELLGWDPRNYTKGDTSFSAVMGYGIGEYTFNLSQEASDSILGVAQWIMESMDYFGSQVDNYIQSSLDSLVDYHMPEFTDVADYNLLQDRLSSEIFTLWEEYYAEQKLLGRTVAEAWQDFYPTISGLVNSGTSAFEQTFNLSKYNKDLQQAEDIFTNPLKYSLEYLTNLPLAISNYFTPEQLQQIQDDAEKRLASAQLGLQEIFSQADTDGLIDLETWGSLPDNLSFLLKTFSQEFYDAYLNQYETILNSRNFSEAGKQAVLNDLILKGVELKAFRTEEQQRQIDQILSSADLTTLEGIFTLEKSLEELDFLAAENYDFDTSILVENLIPNLTLEWENLTNTLTSSIKDFTTALGEAASGMNFDEALAMADKLGLTIKDFTFKNGKYFLDSANRLNEYLKTEEETYNLLIDKTNAAIGTAEGEGWLKQTTYAGYDRTILEHMDSLFLNGTAFKDLEYADQLDAVSQWYPNGEYTEQQIIESISYYNQYIDAYQKAFAEGTFTGTFTDYVVQELQKASENYEAASEYVQWEINNTLLALGAFTDFFNNLRAEAAEKQIDDATFEQDILALQEGRYADISAEGRAILSPYIASYIENTTGAIREVTEQIGSAIGTEDIIQANELNKDILTNLANVGILKTIDLEQGIYQVAENVSEETYAAVLLSYDLTIEEVNEAVAQIHDYNLSKSGSSEAIFSNILEIVENADSLGYDVLTQLANNLNTTVDQIEPWFTKNLDGTYTASYQDIQNLIIAFGLESSNEIKDALNSYLDNILGIISNGISGSMTNVEFTQLGEYLSSITGEQIDLQVTQTAEGLKLTEDSLLRVYSTLEGINSLAAKVVLDELVEDAMDSDESLNNIYNVMNKIADINDEIAKAGGDSNREKALRAELAIAEGIRDTLLEAGDAFNFMDQDLPTSLSNPLSLWEGTADALSILDGDEYKNGTGTIDFTSFYNMINMMEQTGVLLENGSSRFLADVGDFTTDAEVAAALIEQATSALTIVDGEVLVDLSKFGTNFQMGTEGMRAGLAEGIQDLAKGQIDLLDAEIAFLETVVASEKAFAELESDGDGIINADELASKIFDTEGDAEKGFLNEESEAYKFLSRCQTAIINVGEETATIGELLKMLDTGEYLEGFTEENVLAALAQYLTDYFNTWGGSDKWTIEGNQLFKDGVEVTLPPITFSKTEEGQTSPIQEWLNTYAGDYQTEIPDFVSKFEATLGENQTEYTLADLVKFAQDNNYSQEFINWLISQKDEILGAVGEVTKEIEVDGETRTITWNPDVQTYVDADGNLYTADGQPTTAAELLQQQVNAFQQLGTQNVDIPLTVTGSVEDGFYLGEEGPFTKEELLAKAKEYYAFDEQTQTYGATADIQITPANITIQTEGETGELVAEDLAVVKATATELIITPTEGGVKLAEETAPTIETMNAVITAFTVNPTATSLAEDATIDIDTEEGTTSIIVDKATIAALSADGVISENGTGGFKLNGTLAELEAKIAELETPANLVKNGDVYTLSGTAIQLSADVVSKLAEKGGILTPTEGGYTLNGTTVAEAELTVAQLASDGLLSLVGGAYTFTGNVKDIDLDINGDPATAKNAIQSIIDAYDNTDVTLNVDIRVGDVDPVLNKYGLQTDRISSAAQTIEAGAQPETGMGFQSGIYAQGDGSKAWGSKWVATTNPVYNETGWSKRGNKSVMTSTEDIINSYLSAIQSEIKAGKLITQEDVQVLNDLQTIANGFNGAESLTWFSTLQETLTLMESTPVEGNGLSATLTQIAGLPLETIVQAIADLTTNSTSLSTLSFENINNFITTLQAATGEDSVAQTGLTAIKQTLEELTAGQYKVDLLYNITSTADQEGTYNVNIEDNGTAETLTNLSTALLNLNTQANALMQSANAITSTGPDNVSALKDQMNVLPNKSVEVGNTASAIDKLKDKSIAVGNTAAAIDKLKSKSITASITVKITAPNPTPGSTTNSTVRLTSNAKGNVALAKGTGKAAAKGKTLMGELGPELVVSNGRYFTVGNNGAEFVDLPSDAIVFNHLQTQKLLGAGGTVGTGEPVTNERNAVALAGGNVTGPAMASAADALAELYKLRAMWEGLLNASAQELGKKGAGLGSGNKPGGGNGGDGGGGGGDGEATNLHDLERWYNLMRQIAKLEQQVTLEQAKRNNMRNGADINKSREKELKLLEKQRDANKELAEQQKKYYDERRNVLNSTDYSKIFTYDEDGLMQYVSGENRGLDALSKLNATDKNGKPLMSSKDQLKYLKETLGFDISTLKTNADGTKTSDPEQMMQNFWDGIDGWMGEMDGLYDSYNDAAIAMEEATSAMNDLIQEQIDNQISVEEKMLKALEGQRQAAIDSIQEEKDLLEAAAQEYIDGLSSALEKERSMYDKNETQAETEKLQRRLAILQRSGGSASEIKSLQDQIDSRLKDAYFEEQQAQIDAIQEASNNEIEKLQNQIDLMTETLEYQKENGLLWTEIYEMMNTWTPEQLLQYIIENDPDYQSGSPTQNEENADQTRIELEVWANKREEDRKKQQQEKEWNDYYDGLDKYSQDQKSEHA